MHVLARGVHLQTTIENIKQVADMLPESIIVFSVGDTIECLYYSQSTPELLGLTPEEYEPISHQDAFLMIMESDRESIRKKMLDCVRGGYDASFSYRLRHKTKGYVWVHCQAHRIGSHDGCPVMLAAIHEISRESKVHELLLERDTLTGAYSRAGFVAQATQVLQAATSSERFAILFFNIKGFKAVNELFGNTVGDGILHTCIDVLGKSFLHPLVIARFEADHFVVLARQENLDYDQLVDLCRQSVELNGKAFRFYARCGVYLVTDRSLDVRGMCDRAKLAKEYITDDFVKPYAVFDDSMKDAFVMARELTSELENALANHEFHVYYQPIYNTRTGRVASAEALVRWMHPTQGVLLPNKFVPAFEENGYITELDLFVTNTVKAFLENRVAQGLPVVPVAANLSRMDFYDDHMMDVLLTNLETSTLPFGMPRFEVTESAYATLVGQRSKVLQSMKDRGAKILIDDFGCGYSSFSTMINFDFDIIKLDMGFVHQIGTNPKAPHIVGAIIDMAHSLGMQVIAEGVETREQVDFLCHAGCDFIQGYYFSRPLPEDAFAEMLNQLSAE